MEGVALAISLFCRVKQQLFRFGQTLTFYVMHTMKQHFLLLSSAASYSTSYKLENIQFQWRGGSLPNFQARKQVYIF